MERDISMKRHLIEDWRLRIKGNQEKEKTFNETLQTLEEKVLHDCYSFSSSQTEGHKWKLCHQIYLIKHCTVLNISDIF